MKHAKVPLAYDSEKRQFIIDKLCFDEGQLRQEWYELDVAERLARIDLLHNPDSEHHMAWAKIRICQLHYDGIFDAKYDPRFNSLQTVDGCPPPSLLLQPVKDTSAPNKGRLIVNADVLKTAATAYKNGEWATIKFVNSGTAQDEAKRAARLQRSAPTDQSPPPAYTP